MAERFLIDGGDPNMWWVWTPEGRPPDEDVPPPGDDDAPPEEE